MQPESPHQQRVEVFRFRLSQSNSAGRNGMRAMAKPCEALNDGLQNT